MEVNEKNINCFKQNKIKYLVRDFAEYGVPEEVTREILLKRGINKWLANRMAIIELKDELKYNINTCLGAMRHTPKKDKYYRELVGTLGAINYIRESIRDICHSSRWQFPE